MTAMRASTRAFSRCSRSTASRSLRPWSAAGWRGGRTAPWSTAIASFRGRISSRGRRRAKCRRRASSNSPRTATTCIAACSPTRRATWCRRRITWQYDPATGSYEDDAQFRARIRARPGARPQPAGGQSRTPAAGPGVAVRPLQRPRPRGRQAGRIHLCADARARARPIPRIFSPSTAIFPRRIPV